MLKNNACHLEEMDRRLTRHEVQQSSGDRVQAGAVRDVGAGVPQHGDDTVGNRPALSRQVVPEAVGRLHEWREHDWLIRQLHRAEYLQQCNWDVCYGWQGCGYKYRYSMSDIFSNLIDLYQRSFSSKELYWGYFLGI